MLSGVQEVNAKERSVLTDVLLWCFLVVVTAPIIRELKQTTTATATRTPQNKRFNEQNNGCARAL